MPKADDLERSVILSLAHKAITVIGIPALLWFGADFIQTQQDIIDSLAKMRTTAAVATEKLQNAEADILDNKSDLGSARRRLTALERCMPTECSLIFRSETDK